ncbi:MAG: SDR family NAD(P)-dependent oxidoreductase [Chloroflexi bacterium]|nr:SDR family NAD(P)-dependent oxidoreductase [Chloroflexota bacterium]
MKRCALITGAAGGIGRATTELFAAEGWDTIAVDRRAAEPFPAGVTSRRADVAVPEDVEALFTWLQERIDRLDALVNNAAIQICKPMVEMPVEEWDAVMNSNLRSAYLTARRGHRLLQAASGAIVNVSSVHAVATSRDIAAYAASKGGLVALTRAMALELAADSIRVNAVLPGAVDTPMLHAGLARDHVAGGTVQERMSDLGKRTVMGRVGRPEEIAQAILFLADGQRSSFVTGQTLIVDGGATARLSTE